MRTLIDNVTLYTGRETIWDACVLVEGSRIGYAGPRSGYAKPEGVERILDGRGGILMPGLSNAHSHAAMTLFRGLGSDLKLQEWLGVVMPEEDKLTGEYVYYGTTLAIAEMVRRGITSFLDMYFFMEDAARAVADTGMRAVLSQGLVADGGERLARNLRLYHDWHGQQDGRIRVMLGPHAEYTTTPESLTSCVEAARREGIGIHIHVSETPREVAECRARRGGKSPVQYLSELGVFDGHAVAAHCVAVDAEDIQILSDKKVHVVHNPASNMKLASGVAPVVDMLRSGVSVSLGTDGASSNNTLDLFADMKLAALLQKGVNQDATLMPAPQVAAMATRAGALAMGFEDVGLIEPGMRADLVLLEQGAPNLTPCFDVPATIVFAAQGLNVRMTMVDGAVLYQDGEYPTLDLERTLGGVHQALRGMGLL